MNKIIALDYIRVISIIFIIVCHCCFSFPEYDWIGRYLGQTFNFLFLMLSSILLGLSWNKKNRPQYNKSFLFHRLGRISTSYYPFIIFMFIFLYITGYNIKAKDLIMHMIFLPWFDKLPGFGHLWFITMIVSCYIFIYYITIIYRYNKQYLIYGGGGILLLFTITAIQDVLYNYNIPAYFVYYIFLYCVVFINANTIIQFIKNIELKLLIIITLSLNIFVLWLYYNGIFEYKSISYPISIICATNIFIFLFKVLLNIKENRYISFISNISFEIYLVHHVLCFGNYSIYYIFNLSPFVGFLIILFTSIGLAYLLHRISLAINHVLIKK